MLPIIAVRVSVGTLVAADPTYLNQATNANLVALVVSPFVPSETLLVASLTFATWPGYVDVNCPFGPALVGVNPATLQQEITIPDPINGYRYVVTGTTGLPQTVYGFALCTKAKAILLASELLPVPLPIQDVGQVIDLGQIRIKLQNPITTP